MLYFYEIKSSDGTEKYYAVSKMNKSLYKNRVKNQFKRYIEDLSYVKPDGLNVMEHDYNNFRIDILNVIIVDSIDKTEQKRLKNQFLLSKQNEGFLTQRVVDADNYNKNYYETHKDRMIKQINDAKYKRKQQKKELKYYNKGFELFTQAINN